MEIKKLDRNNFDNKLFMVFIYKLRTSCMLFKTVSSTVALAPLIRLRSRSA